MDASVPTIMWPGFESPPSKPINNSKNVLNLKTIDGHKNNKSGWKCSMAEISLHRDGGCLLRTAVSMSRSDNRLLTINNFCRILTFKSLTLGYIQCDQMATSFFNIWPFTKIKNCRYIFSSTYYYSCCSYYHLYASTARSTRLDNSWSSLVEA